MNINNPLPPDRMYTDDGLMVHCRVIDVPPWNMDTTANINIPHGLGALWSNIISINVWIMRDGVTILVPLMSVQNNADPLLLGGGIYWITPTDINLQRRTGGQFDSANYSAVLVNRGKMLVWYHE